MLEIEWDEKIRVHGWDEHFEAIEVFAPHYFLAEEYLMPSVRLFQCLAIKLPRIEQLHMDVENGFVVKGIRSEDGQPMKIRILEETEVQALSSRYPFDFSNRYS